MLKTVRNLEEELTLKESPLRQYVAYQDSKPPTALKEVFPGA